MALSTAVLDIAALGFLGDWRPGTNARMGQHDRRFTGCDLSGALDSCITGVINFYHGTGDQSGGRWLAGCDEKAAGKLMQLLDIRNLTLELETPDGLVTQP